jgi:hypothetical protein
LKILVSVVRFRPGPPRNTKPRFMWGFFISASILEETSHPLNPNMLLEMRSPKFIWHNGPDFNKS